MNPAESCSPLWIPEGYSATARQKVPAAHIWIRETSGQGIRGQKEIAPQVKLNFVGVKLRCWVVFFHTYSWPRLSLSFSGPVLWAVAGWLSPGLPVPKRQSLTWGAGSPSGWEKVRRNKPVEGLECNLRASSASFSPSLATELRNQHYNMTRRNLILVPQTKGEDLVTFHH